MNFSEWLADNHPSVRLTPMQQTWVDAAEQGDYLAWVGGSRSGRSFVLRLWEEFETAHDSAHGGSDAL